MFKGEQIALSAETKGQPKNKWERTTEEAISLLKREPGITEENINEAEEKLKDSDFQKGVYAMWENQAVQFGDSDPDEQEKNQAIDLKNTLKVLLQKN